MHLSYAPRWRIIDRLDRGLQPFEGMIRTIDSPDPEEAVVTEDDELEEVVDESQSDCCLLYTSPSPRDKRQSRMPSSA